MSAFTRNIAFKVLLAIVIYAAAFAGDANVMARVDRTEVSQDENVEYSVEIGGDVSNFPNVALPKLADFDVFSSGTSQSFTWINGKSQNTKRYVFRLSPKRAGRLEVPAFALDIDGKRYMTQAQYVQVSPGRGGSQARNSNPNPQPRQRQAQGAITRDDLFIRTVADKDTVYVNEQITLSFKFFQGIELLQNPDYQAPQKTGFWVEDLGPQKSSYQTVAGRDYRVTEIKTGLFPTSSGVQTIGSATLTCLVQDRPRNRDPFSIFNNFGVFGETKSVKLASDPIEIVALPLPTRGKPVDFGGAVGQFTMSTSVDKTTVPVNEPITMTVRISGIGNVKTIGMPTIPEIPDFRTYQAGDSENIERVNYELGGSKIYEQVFIPKRAGTYTIPGLSFSYFDPKAKSYKTLTSEPIRVEATPSQDRFASQLQNLQTNRIDLAAKDIRYLKTEAGNLNSRRSQPLAMSPLFLAFYLIPVLGYIAVIQQQRRKERFETDHGFRRLKQARKMAEGRLAKAKAHLSSKDPDAFYTETNRSLIDYFADRYNLPAFGLTADKIKAFAAGKQSDQLIAKMLELLQQCDFGRFAPGGSEHSQMQKLWEDARQLIIDLEKTR
ncbi:MAG: BatD family protein [Candidatus Zixiibacteriota bacterium]